jgi:hypothetical protein
MIIGICGFIGSGKDTIADYLVNFHGYRRESFANSLKDAVAAVFGWDRVMLEGRTNESRAWREKKDEWWSQRLGKEITPRHILQYWGTEVIRNGFHDDMWIASLENKLRQSNDDIVITDCRFPNEIKALRSQNALIIWVQRGKTPSWYDIATRANTGDKQALQWLIDNKIHASEYSWAGTQFDAIIDNNKSIDSLYNQIKNLVSDHLVSSERHLYVGVSDSLHILS